MYTYKYDKHHDAQVRRGHGANSKCMNPTCGGNIWTSTLIEVWNRDDTDYHYAYVWQCNNCGTQVPRGRRPSK